MKPYLDEAVGEQEIIRTFDETIDPVELMWHRDDEDRLIESVGETDWLIQVEDTLPVIFSEPIMIRRHVWHRLIKGTGNLTVRIKKM